MNVIPVTPLTLDLARRVIWFEPPEKALSDPIRFMTYAMTCARHEDMREIRWPLRSCAIGSSRKPASVRVAETIPRLADAGELTPKVRGRLQRSLGSTPVVSLPSIVAPCDERGSEAGRHRVS